MKQKNITTKVTKWGNSFGIRLPLDVINNLSISEGSELLLEQNKDYIKISKKNSSLEDVALATILKGVNPKTFEGNTDEFFGKPQGNEIW